jgi:hypothetical protein
VMRGERTGEFGGGVRACEEQARGRGMRSRGEKRLLTRHRGFAARTRTSYP